MLVRRRVDSLLLLENLNKVGVPVEVIGAREYFREPVVQAVIAYLRVLADPRRHQAAPGQLMLQPVHGVAKADIPRLGRLARDRECSLWEAMEDPEARCGLPVAEWKLKTMVLKFHEKFEHDWKPRAASVANCCGSRPALLAD